MGVGAIEVAQRWLPGRSPEITDPLLALALAWLMRHTRERHFTLIDTQWMTAHLALFGASEIPRNEYLRRLRNALRLPARFTDDGPSAVLTIHGE